MTSAPSGFTVSLIGSTSFFSGLLASPPPIGNTTPNTGAFTTLTTTVPLAQTSGGTGVANTSLIPVTATGSTTPRSLATRFADWVNVLDFGADPTGMAPSNTAIQNAINTGQPVYIPPGNYLITQITVSNAPIFGAGQYLTILTSTSTTLDAIVGVNGFDISNLTITRNVTPTAGAGILIPANCTGFLNKILSENHWYGFDLGAVSTATASYLIAQSNYSHGFNCTTVLGTPSFQWVMDNLISQFNNGCGYHFYTASQGGGDNVDQTGPIMLNVGSYANNGNGMLWDGPAGTAWNDILATNCYSSFDGNSGIAFNNAGRNNQFLSIFCEYAGQANTGRNQATSKSNVGTGFVIQTSGRTDSNFILSGVVQFNSWAGVSIYNNVVTHVSIVGLVAQDNGAAGSNQQGVAVTSTTCVLTISNLTAGNSTSTNQLYGLSAASTAQAANIFIASGNLRGNVTAATSPAASYFNNGAGLLAVAA